MLKINASIFSACILMLLSIFSFNLYGASLKPGDSAPLFTLKSLNGKQIALQDLLTKGHVMLVFWETQCVYCFSHIREFNELHQRYTGKLTIAAINFLGELEGEVREYVEDYNVMYMNLTDRIKNIKVAEDYKVFGSPTIVLIAPNGKILFYGHKIPDLSKWITNNSPDQPNN